MLSRHVHREEPKEKRNSWHPNQNRGAGVSLLSPSTGPFHLAYFQFHPSRKNLVLDYTRHEFLVGMYSRVKLLGWAKDMCCGLTRVCPLTKLTVGLNPR